MLRFPGIRLKGRDRFAAGMAGVLCLVAGYALAQDNIPVPSGQAVTFHEQIISEDGPSARFRFVAPAIARDRGEISFADAEPDIVHLCEHFVLPRVADLVPVPVQIIISLSDRPVEFGNSDPQATQFFEAFRSENGLCIWEGV